MPFPYKIGDRIHIAGTPPFDKIVLEVIDVDESGEIEKAKCLVHDKRLLAMGFVQEGELIVALRWHWSLS